jgi:hypothetical protein
MGRVWYQYLLIPLSPSTISELMLLLFHMIHGGLKLHSRPNVRITPFHALADNEDVLDEYLNQSVQKEAPWSWD